MCFQCFGGQLEAVFNACFYSNGCAVCKCYDRAVTDKAGLRDKYLIARINERSYSKVYCFRTADRYKYLVQGVVADVQPVIDIVVDSNAKIGKTCVCGIVSTSFSRTLIASFLIAHGVLKSGSPTDSDITSS